MEFSKEQIEELKQISPNLGMAEEGGYSYILLKDHPLPAGCKPERMDLLLCPMPKGGYSSILYFAQRPIGCMDRNWNGHAQVLGRAWYSYSWKMKAGYTLLQMLQIHLNALRK